MSTWETEVHSGICASCGMPSDWADSCSQGCEPPSLGGAA